MLVRSGEKIINRTAFKETTIDSEYKVLKIVVDRRYKYFYRWMCDRRKYIPVKSRLLITMAVIKSAIHL